MKAIGEKATMTVSKNTKIGEIITRKVNEMIGVFTPDSWEVISTPRYTSSKDSDANYSYYDATVVRIK